MTLRRIRTLATQKMINTTRLSNRDKDFKEIKDLYCVLVVSVLIELLMTDKDFKENNDLSEYNQNTDTLEHR